MYADRTRLYVWPYRIKLSNKLQTLCGPAEDERSNRPVQANLLYRTICIVQTWTIGIEIIRFRRHTFRHSFEFLRHKKHANSGLLKLSEKKKFVKVSAKSYSLLKNRNIFVQRIEFFLTSTRSTKCAHLLFEEFFDKINKKKLPSKTPETLIPVKMIRSLHLYNDSVKQFLFFSYFIWYIFKLNRMIMFLSPKMFKKSSNLLSWQK